MRLFVIFTCLALIGATLGSGGDAHAAPGANDSSSDAASADEQARETARKRFKEGVAAYDEGRFKDAIDLLLAADEAMHSPAFAFNVGLAYQAMGDVSNALRWYRTYLRELPEAEDRDQVEGMIREMEGKLASRGVQQLTVLSQPAGATVLIDDSPVGVTPWTGDLQPRPHAITLQLRGYRDAETTVEMDLDHARDVTLTLEEAPPAPEGGPPAGAPTDRGTTAGVSDIGIWTWVSLGAGTGALGGALAFELLRQGAVDDAEQAPQVDYLDTLDRAERHQLTARILAGVGGALLATGATLLVLDLTRDDDPSSIQARLGCTPTGCTVMAGGQL